MRYLIVLIGLFLIGCSASKYTISQKMLNSYDNKKLSHIYFSEKSNELLFEFDNETLLVPLPKRYLKHK